MREIIDWLIAIEDMAADLYKNASLQFRADEEFSGFLSRLADDEAWHSLLLKKAAGPFPEEGSIILDKATKEKIETPFNGNYSMLLSGALTRESLLDCIITAEFSELNNVFLYVVTSMMQRSKDAGSVALKMQDHVAAIEEYLASLPDGQKYIDRISQLPEIGRKKILIVEDDATTNKLLQALLNKEGAVESALNGREALDKVTHGFFNAIISDIEMPVMDGIEFYKEASRAAPVMQERFLFFTGSCSPEHFDFLRENHLRYLKKPSPIKDIIQAVHEILYSSKVS
ncbi:MAG: response regulator [Nitrospirae bacterium]|nr:response regulator [Nitrospirota bacterium]